MRRLVNIFAVWFIVIAFPVQGLAAATMMNCEQSANHHSQIDATDHHHVQSSDHHSPDHHSHELAKACDHATHSTDKNKHSCAHCAKCTSFCSGFTFQATALDPFQQPNTNEVRFSDSTTLLKGFIPSGLERPPRFTLI